MNEHPDEVIAVERAKLQAVLDLATNSMDFGSGFWDDEEAKAARAVAELLGQCPNACTPSGLLGHFPPCEGTWRRAIKTWHGGAFEVTHHDHGGEELPINKYASPKWEPWRPGEES